MLSNQQKIKVLSNQQKIEVYKCLSGYYDYFNHDPPEFELTIDPKHPELHERYAARLRTMLFSAIVIGRCVTNNKYSVGVNIYVPEQNVVPLMMFTGENAGHERGVVLAASGSFFQYFKEKYGKQLDDIFIVSFMQDILEYYREIFKGKISKKLRILVPGAIGGRCALNEKFVAGGVGLISSAIDANPARQKALAELEESNIVILRRSDNFNDALTNYILKSFGHETGKITDQFPVLTSHNKRTLLLMALTVDIDYDFQHMLGLATDDVSFSKEFIRFIHYNCVSKTYAYQASSDGRAILNDLDLQQFLEIIRNSFKIEFRGEFCEEKYAFCGRGEMTADKDDNDYGVVSNASSALLSPPHDDGPITDTEEVVDSATASGVTSGNIQAAITSLTRATQ